MVKAGDISNTRALKNALGMVSEINLKTILILCARNEISMMMR
jgi:hypothetical protein